MSNLIPRINGKTLIIKDGSRLYDNQEEAFRCLREIYDKPTLWQRLRNWWKPNRTYRNVNFKIKIGKE